MHSLFVLKVSIVVISAGGGKNSSENAVLVIPLPPKKKCTPLQLELINYYNTRMILYSINYRTHRLTAGT